MALRTIDMRAWILPAAGIAAAIVAAGITALALQPAAAPQPAATLQSPAALQAPNAATSSQLTFAQLQVRVRREGVDRVADELRGGKPDGVLALVANALDQTRCELRDAPEQLWFQLANRNLDAGAELAAFLGAPPRGPMLRVKSRSLRQYSPGLLRSQFDGEVRVRYLRLSDDGTKLFCVLSDDTLRVLDPDTFREIARRDPPANLRERNFPQSINNPWVGLDKNGGAVFAEQPAEFAALDASAWQRALRNVYKPTQGFSSVSAASSDGTHVIIFSKEYGEHKLIAISLADPAARIECKLDDEGFAFDPALVEPLSGDRVLIADQNGNISLFRWRTGERLQPTRQLFNSAAAYEVSPDGTRLVGAPANAYVSINGRGSAPRAVVKVWDVDAWQEVAVWEGPGDSYVGAVDFLGDRDTIAAAGIQLGTVTVWRVGSDKPLHTLAAPTPLQSCVASRDGRRLFTVSLEGALMMLDVARLPEAEPVANHQNQVRAVAISADGARAASLDKDGGLALWDVEAARRLGMTKLPSSAVATAVTEHDPLLGFGADNRRVVVGAVSAKGPLIVRWDGATGEVDEIFAVNDRLAALQKIADARSRLSGGGLQPEMMLLRPLPLPGRDAAICLLGPPAVEQRLIMLDSAAGNTIGEQAFDPKWGETIAGVGRQTVAFLSYSADGATVTGVDLQSDERPQATLFPERVFVAALSSENDVLAANGYARGDHAEDESAMAFVHLRSGTVKRTTVDGLQTALAVSPDGSSVATGDAHGRLRL